MSEYEATRHAIEQVVELLLPHVTVQEQRVALVQASWGPATRAQYEIDYGGSPRQFAERFVPATLKFGRSLGDTDTAAIELVLQYLRQLVGEGDEQQQIDRLLRQLAQPAFLEIPAPYKGLEPYGKDDYPFYFGRSALITNVTNRIVNWTRNPNATRFLAIVGASGTGKSSLVRAGLLPSIEQQVDWKLVVMRPNPDPLFNLAVELTDDDIKPRAIATSLAADPETLLQCAQQKLANTWSEHSGVLLVVDQFEELLSGLPTDADPELLQRTREERFAFVDNLLYAASAPAAPLAVVVTLRSDFYPEFQLDAGYAHLWTVLKTHHEWLEPLSAEDMREIIEGPAARAGYQIETGLADAILGDLDLSGGRPKIGSLPLLSTALLQTWEYRRGGELRREDYWNAGGVTGAIRNLAEDAYQSLRNDDQRKIAEELFLRMTHTGEGIKPTRRRVPVSELQLQSFNSAAVSEVVDHLLGYRLIVKDKGNEDGGDAYVELIHEALIHEWSRFAQWLQDDLEVQRFLRPLTESAERWHVNGRDASFLYTGNRLSESKSRLPSERLNALETEFLEASHSAEQGSRRQRWGLLAVSAIAALILVVLLSNAFTNWLEVSRSRRLARGEVVQISGGEFSLGFDTSVTQVTLEPFKIQRFEVSVAQYCHCFDADECELPAAERDMCDNPERLQHPARFISAVNALKFCRFVEGSLPTYAQWERAARGPLANPWPWGEATPDPTRANLLFPQPEYELYPTDTVTTTSKTYQTGDTIFEAESGIRHLVGNVWEWTATGNACPEGKYICEQTWQGDERVDLLVAGGSFRERMVGRDLNYTFDFLSSNDDRDDLGFRCVFP